ncbi:MAG: T9SS type A sorting domain-containing protein, partial [Bacteroidota bacterium]
TWYDGRGGITDIYAQQINASGQLGVVTSVENLSSATPQEFHLDQNYPNPFNPSTTIRFDVPVATHVSVEVFNMIGEKMTTLVNEVKLPGRYRVLFNGDGMPSGLYSYRLRTEGFVSVGRMVLMK